MIHIIPISLLTLVGLFLLWPITRKPLSEDEGLWYYQAVFWKRGLGIHNGINVKFYLDVQHMAVLFFNFLPGKSIVKLQYFKLLWYTATCISVYSLAFVLWGNIFLSLIAGILFLIAVAIPSTFFTVTYAEHFFILPANLSITFAYLGLTQNDMTFIFVSGIFSAWMYQQKMPTILFCIVLPILFLSGNTFLSSLICYSSGYLILTLMPILVALFYGIPYVKGCLCYSFSVYVIVLSVIAKRLNISFLELILTKVRHFLEITDQGSAYVEKNLSKHNSWKQLWEDIKVNIYPPVKDLYPILILAISTSLVIISTLDFRVLLLVCLFTIFLSMVYIQKNFYTPHFSPIWSPLSILAAKAIWDFCPSHSTNRTLSWFMIAFLGYSTFKITKIISKTFYRSEINAIGHLDPLFGKVFRLCESVGKYIRDNSNKNDKLFVWGDQPSIYLYAEREAINYEHIIIYAHNNRIVAEKELLDSLRNKPPELLIFYNCKVIDGWNIKRLQETIGIPYDHMKSFQITDDRHKKPDNPQGICFNFPLYRRNDKIYSEILIDRAINAEANNDLNQTREHLNKTLVISPECFEASLRLTLLDEVGSRKKHRCYIEKRGEEINDPVSNSILLRLLSEKDAEEGDFHSALKNLERAHDLNSDDFRIYNALGELYFSMDKIEDAAKSFNRAVGLNAYSVDAYNNIGVILAQEGKYANAIKCFSKALSIMPGHQDTLKNMKNLSSV